MKLPLLTRKGLMHAFLVSLIILLLSFGLIAVWLYRAGIIINDEADVNACRATLAVQTKTDADIPFLHINSPFKSSCKRRFIEIGEDTVKVKGSGALAIKKDFSVWISDANDPSKIVRTAVRTDVTQEIASSVLAESLRRCYTMGLEGDIKAFNRESFLNSNVCMICDEIYVDRNSNVAIPASEGDTWLRDYLAATTMPGSTVRGVPQTYATFLDYEGPQANDNYPFSIALLEQQQINKDYALVDGNYVTIMIRRFGGFFGNQEGRMAVAIVPSSKVRVLCDAVAN